MNNYFKIELNEAKKGINYFKKELSETKMDMNYLKIEIESTWYKNAECTHLPGYLLGPMDYSAIYALIWLDRITGTKSAKSRTGNDIIPSTWDHKFAQISEVNNGENIFITDKDFLLQKNYLTDLSDYESLNMFYKQILFCAAKDIICTKREKELLLLLSHIRTIHYLVRRYNYFDSKIRTSL